MIAINIIGNGVLEFDGKVSIALKRENHQGSWGRLTMGRSAAFTIPATEHNRIVLGFADDVVEYGDAMRVSYPAQMQYSGGSVDGTLSVTSFSGGRYSCVFFYPVGGIDAINDKKLADCFCDIKAIQWSENNAVDADNAALPTRPVAIVRYDRPATYNPPQRPWPCLPSLSIKLYVENILDNLGVRHDLDIPANLRLVTPTLKGIPSVTGRVAKTGLTAGTIDPSLSSLLEFKTNAALSNWDHWFGIVTTTPCWAIRPKVDVEITFPSDFPNAGELIQLNGKVMTPVTDRYRDTSGWHGTPLAGRTVSIAAGKWFFIVTDLGSPYGDSYLTGWTSDVSPFDFELTVASTGEIDVDGIWSPAVNAPDMTIVEYLRSVALMLGKELYIVDNRIVIKDTDIGSDTRERLDAKGDVVETVQLSRNVQDWGSDVRSETVRFDSEDYVQTPLRQEYVINNGNLEKDETQVIKWSEGNVDADGDVVIHDVELNGQDTKLTAKKWTVGVTGAGTRLKRAELEGYIFGSSLARMSTCITVRVIRDIDTFLRMTFGAYYYHAGLWWVWTSAQWQDGIATLTLQAV